MWEESTPRQTGRSVLRTRCGPFWLPFSPGQLNNHKTLPFCLTELQPHSWTSMISSKKLHTLRTKVHPAIIIRPPTRSPRASGRIVGLRYLNIARSSATRPYRETRFPKLVIGILCWLLSLFVKPNAQFTLAGLPWNFSITCSLPMLHAAMQL